MKETYQMKNWEIVCNDTGSYVCGEVYGRDDFVDGTNIRTSRIVGIQDFGDRKIVETLNSRYELMYKYGAI